MCNIFYHLCGGLSREEMRQILKWKKRLKSFEKQDFAQKQKSRKDKTEKGNRLSDWKREIQLSSSLSFPMSERIICHESRMASAWRARGLTEKRFDDIMLICICRHFFSVCAQSLCSAGVCVHAPELSTACVDKLVETVNKSIFFTNSTQKLIKLYTYNTGN